VSRSFEIVPGSWSTAAVVAIVAVFSSTPTTQAAAEPKLPTGSIIEKVPPPSTGYGRETHDERGSVVGPPNAGEDV
jgi:hypothetical protein